MAHENARFDTQAIHAGYAPDATGSRQVPIYQTSAYVFDDAADASDKFTLKKVGNVYSRLTNPTNTVLETRLAALEGGVGATVAASGHAGQLIALLALMQPGDNIVASNRLYGGTINQFKNTFRRHFGWECIFVDVDDPQNVAKAINAKTKAVYAESLANPGGVLTDIEALATIAHASKASLITVESVLLIGVVQQVEVLPLSASAASPLQTASAPQVHGPTADEESRLLCPAIGVLRRRSDRAARSANLRQELRHGIHTKESAIRRQFRRHLCGGISRGPGHDGRRR